ncbi:Transcription factor E2FA [Glycine soja]|uniref:Transcription factor E2FA n=1 Tax=Glycine soja TaxID=3848 RepID=A0A445HQT9_GLYSO|nr:Transcription factor E2FA [Glycine soja]
MRWIGGNNVAAEVEKLSSEEQGLDDQIRPVHFCKLNETLIAIKALHGTTLEVPNPEEAVDHRERRYKIILRSTMGPLIQFEEVSGADLPMIPLASSFGSIEQLMTEMVPTKCSGKELEPQTQLSSQAFSDL